MKGRIRRREVPFTQVSNTPLKDLTLSLKAKGLYSLIQCYITIPDYELYKEFLEKKCKEGSRAFDSAWFELKDSGYLIQSKTRDESGQYLYEYEVCDTKSTPTFSTPG